MSVEPEDIPVIGPWIGTAGGIGELWAMPCLPRIDIFFAAALFHLPGIWWHVVKPSVGNELRALFRSGGGRGSHGRKKQKAGLRPKVSWTNPSLVEATGLSGHLDDFVKWAHVRMPLAITGEIGFYMIVFDALAQYMINWTTTAYQWAGCLPSEAGPTRLEASEPTITQAGATEPVLYGIVEGDPGLNGVDGLIIPAGYDMSFGCHLKIKPWSFQPDNVCDVIARVVVSPTLEVLASMRGRGNGTSSTEREAFVPLRLAPASFDRKVRIVTTGTGVGYCDLAGTSISGGETHVVRGAFKWDP